MKILKDSPECKKLYVRTVIISSLLFLSTLLLLSFLHVRSNNQIEDLVLENDLHKEEIVTLESLLETEETLEDEEETEEISEEESDEEEAVDCSSFEETINSLRMQVTVYQGKLGRIEEYNDIHKFIYDVIIAHDGFTDWTDAEYEIARDMASGLGDEELMAAIENAWTNLDGEPAARFARVMLAIINGIDGNL